MATEHQLRKELLKLRTRLAETRDEGERERLWIAAYELEDTIGLYFEEREPNPMRQIMDYMADGQQQKSRHLRIVDP